MAEYSQYIYILFTSKVNTFWSKDIAKFGLGVSGNFVLKNSTYKNL